MSKDLKYKIREIERMFGSIKELRKELKEKEAKFGKDIHLVSKIEKNYQVNYKILYIKLLIVYIFIYLFIFVCILQMHLERLESRKKLFLNMKHMYGEKIQNSFSNVLALRNKKVCVSFD